ncbi:DUF3267 domain-containing protein [Barnesiella sp. An55]|uniref:DUF3267 domain-containing protein n=1 Tax=Barnesiella sp. An55 TaxID=1965646 RepID=UPI000B3692E5|nr:DUF3267 domain-containing protein [Barnesiella sp. An55]OUN74790.1 hypothetical protein B5G10_00785 [Barnesiella sp. An55]HIZ26310.1 DUF3267 domain-containing protein [Candidatus Barnesiella merdipullorum]
MDKETFLAFYEKAGYRVIDSFAYSDIKRFLARNRPSSRFRITYYVVLLLVLFAIGFMIGILWNETRSVGPFLLEIGKSIALALVGCAILIPLHEFIHWLVYRSEGAADVRFGAVWRSFTFYAAAHNFMADYITFSRVALAPLRILSGLLIVLLLFPMPWCGRIAVGALLLFHLLSCSGDLMMYSYMNQYRHRPVFTVDDIDNRYTYFLEKE